MASQGVPFPLTGHTVVHGVDRSAIQPALWGGGRRYKAWKVREGRTTCRVLLGSRFPVLVSPTPPSAGGRAPLLPQLALAGGIEVARGWEWNPRLITWQYMGLPARPYSRQCGVEVGGTRRGRSGKGEPLVGYLWGPSSWCWCRRLPHLTGAGLHCCPDLHGE